ncbi:MAG: hypothetical protein J7M09_01760 [Deltaproteobacteria bacterium]|nr:hypothetical protein [Candidatus Tharpella sp.]
MDAKKIELLENRVAALEFTLKQLEIQMSRIFGDLDEGFQLPLGLVPLSQQEHR